MSEYCPACEHPLVRLDVPADLREFGPEEAAVVGSCPRCLRTYAVDDDFETTADPPESIPDDGEALSASGSRTSSGNGGVAILLALGLLDSLATNRRAIQSLVEYAESSGADVFLALDRLAADESVEAHADLDRRRRQLESMLE